MEENINVLLTTVQGLGLPGTLCLPLPIDLAIDDLLALIYSLVPTQCARHLYLTTISNEIVHPSRWNTLGSLATTNHCAGQIEPDMLSLRMAIPLVGGKGGFGSQLRAAGGRMSSRKRKQNAELATGSARNLDGRRLRTITEAKNLATYLATKPEMDRRQKEERRRRWEQVIELAEQREADMRAGKSADGRRKGLTEEWIEEKEEVGENVKNAVKLAMSEGVVQDRKHGGGSDVSVSDSADELSDDEDPMELGEEDMARLTREAENGDPDAIWVLKNQLKIPTSLLPKQKQRPRFAGFDDDDDDDDDHDASSIDHEIDARSKNIVEADDDAAAGKNKSIVRDA